MRCFVPCSLDTAGCPQRELQPLPPPALPPQPSELSFLEGEEGDALASETEASHAQLCSAELASEQLSHVCPRTGLDVGPPL